MHSCRTRAVKHLRETYTAPAWWVYTDGSTDLDRGGAGAVLYPPDPDSTPLTVVAAAGRRASAYQAELVALREALTRLRGVLHRGQVAVICTDSQSALRALQAGPARVREDVLHRIWTLLFDLTLNLDATIHLQYVPAHVGIEGNEVADGLAAKGRDKPQEEPLSYAGAKAAVRRYHDPLTPRQGTLYWTDGILKRPPLPMPALKRREEVLIRQLRAGRHRLLWDFRRGEDDKNTPPCPFCEESCDIEHVFSCERLEEERKKTLSTTDPRKLLFRRPTEVVRYLTEVGLADTTLAEVLSTQPRDP
eukprot:TRINITY_DN1472_c2_g2_i4.p1 TRINITY_DN1472_c2_g2~~TRINITY_DN1472_c2_g2_i4.p1  ORF type:complete len:305 (+),score=18.90 TRINITY_DN1472_c2_g2_i4:1175-2089(+)